MRTLIPCGIALAASACHAPPALLWLWACQAPFGSDRHNLQSDRVAAVTLQLDDATASPLPYDVIAGRPYTDEGVERLWFLLAPGDDPRDPDLLETEPDAFELFPTFPRTDESQPLLLATTFPSGWVERTVITVPALGVAPMETPTGLTVQAIDGWTLTSPTEDELDVEERAAAPTSPSDHVPLSGWGRVTADLPTTANLVRTRWMQVGDRGTFLELNPTTTDWAAGQLLLDDLEIEEATPADAGPGTWLVVALSDDTSPTALAADVWVGAPLPGAWVHHRWMASDPPVEAEGFYRVTLRPDESAPTGLRLENTTSVTLPELVGDDPFGVEALGCEGPVSGPFNPTWLFQGRCRRAQVAGATVVVEASP